MKTPNLIKYTSLIAVMIAGGGCATKSAREVTAHSYTIPIQKAPENWAIEAAPRTQPGKIMDPEAITYAQVPSRIIYLPGGGQIFGRSSPRQEVAYNLIPVGRIPEVQAGGTPSFEKKVAPQEKPSASTFSAEFPDGEGNSARGSARRLGVLGKTEDEKTRAQALLSRDETLQWTPDTGWVGFTEEVIVRPLTPNRSLETISPTKEEAEIKPPQIEIPETEETPEKENSREIPEKEENTLKNLGLELDLQ